MEAIIAMEASSQNGRVSGSKIHKYQSPKNKKILGKQQPQNQAKVVAQREKSPKLLPSNQISIQQLTFTPMQGEGNLKINDRKDEDKKRQHNSIVHSQEDGSVVTNKLE